MSVTSDPVISSTEGGKFSSYTRIENSLTLSGVPVPSDTLREKFKSLNAWQAHQTLPLAPLFVSETNSTFVIDEDSIGGVLFDFQVEHPFESNFTWSVTSGGGSPDTYTLSATDGVFSYFPESNFSGVINFTIQAQSLNGANTHDFSVQINPIPDSPIFDYNQSTELTPTWIGEAYSQFINVFDSDSDSNLTLHALLRKALIAPALFVSSGLPRMIFPFLVAIGSDCCTLGLVPLLSSFETNRQSLEFPSCIL